jgi:hypothetical protein
VSITQSITQEGNARRWRGGREKAGVRQDPEADGRVIGEVEKKGSVTRKTMIVVVASGGNVN